MQQKVNFPEFSPLFFGRTYILLTSVCRSLTISHRKSISFFKDWKESVNSFAFFYPRHDAIGPPRFQPILEHVVTKARKCYHTSQGSFPVTVFCASHIESSVCFKQKLFFFFRLADDKLLRIRRRETLRDQLCRRRQSVHLERHLQVHDGSSYVSLNVEQVLQRAFSCLCGSWCSVSFVSIVRHL